MAAQSGDEGRARKGISQGSNAKAETRTEHETNERWSTIKTRGREVITSSWSQLLVAPQHAHSEKLPYAYTESTAVGG